MTACPKCGLQFAEPVPVTKKRLPILAQTVLLLGGIFGGLILIMFVWFVIYSQTPKGKADLAKQQATEQANAAAERQQAQAQEAQQKQVEANAEAAKAKEAVAKAKEAAKLQEAQEVAKAAPELAVIGFEQTLKDSAQNSGTPAFEVVLLDKDDPSHIAVYVPDAIMSQSPSERDIKKLGRTLYQSFTAIRISAKVPNPDECSITLYDKGTDDDLGRFSAYSNGSKGLF